MKKYSIAAALACALLFSGPAAAEDQRKNISQEQANGIAEMLTRPVREVVKPAADKAGKDLYEALQYSNGASWALWDLVNGLAAQQKAGGVPKPDLNLIETYIRLRMRCNTADLCLRNSTCKAYPGDGEFAKAAQLALRDIKTYTAGLKGKSPLTRQHRMRLDNFLETARKRVLFSLKTTRELNVDPTPATPAEEAYRQAALNKRQGPKFTQPPWP